MQFARGRGHNEGVADVVQVQLSSSSDSTPEITPRIAAHAEDTQPLQSNHSQGKILRCITIFLDLESIAQDELGICTCRFCNAKLFISDTNAINYLFFKSLLTWSFLT